MKAYLCIMTLEILIKIIVEMYLEQQQKTMSNCKFNHSNLSKGLKNDLITDLIYNKISDESFLHFCKSYIKFNPIKKDRSFPRVSRRPFTKWYVKNYSGMAEYNKIINAIKSNCLDKLHKNLKSKAKRILKIDGIDCTSFIT